MNAPSIIPTETLPTLIDQATAALESARTSAEVLEARDMARVAYDAAKSAARMGRAKQAHDSLIADVHRAQARALAIRARAEMRLAQEYDDAQERGEIATAGNPNFSDGEKLPGWRDAGLSPKDLHEARRFSDAERDDPGIINRAIDGMVERGEEPTRAALRREVMERPKPQRTMNPRALWLWGRIKDFEREGVLSEAPERLAAEMTEPMRADVRRLLPEVIAFLNKMEKQV
jgi:hypothetical protein